MDVRLADQGRHQHADGRPGNADNHTGGTTINDGTFILNGINSNTANTLTDNHSAARRWSTTVGGNGTNAGPVNDQRTPSGREWAAHPARLARGASRWSTAQTTIFSLGSATTAGGGVNDLLNVTGDFDPNDSLRLHQSGGTA